MNMPGIRFLRDRKGRRKAVLIDLNKHKRLWEDLCDGTWRTHAAVSVASPLQPKNGLSKAATRVRRVADYRVVFARSVRKELQNFDLTLRDASSGTSRR